MEHTTTDQQARDPVAALSGRWLAALNAHDVDAVMACYTQDAVFTDLGTGQVARGAAELRPLVETFFATFQNLSVETVTELTDGDRFAHEFTMSGVHGGSVPGLSATGKSFALAGAVVADVQHGKLSRVTEYWNMADLLTQVGVLPSPAGGETT